MPTDPVSAAPFPGGKGLHCMGLTARYGSLQVCHGIDVGVGGGEIVALLGPNGAGKTSFVGAVSGMVASSGSVWLDGQMLAGLPAHKRATHGLATIPDNRGLFPSLSVAENMKLGARLAPAADRKAAIEHAIEMFPVLKSRLGALAGSLSGGEQQMLAVAKSLAARPRAIVLDEPTQGLAPRVVAELGRILDRLRALRLPLLLVEQNLGLVEDVADRFLVITGGRTAMAGTRKDLADREQIARTFLAV
ncbi:MAG: ATP-binding cassette domain-containing protein [Rubrivivax sp.]